MSITSKPTEQQKRIGIFSTLFGAFGQGNDANRIKIYLKATGDIPVGLLDKACRKLLLECRFLPTIAEIVEAVRQVVARADEESRIKQWDEAWREIERAMFDTPWGDTPTFSTPEIAITVRNYGWNTLQTSLEADMPTVRAQIRRMYDDVCRRTKEDSNTDYAMNGRRESLITPGRDADNLLDGSTRKGSLNSAREVLELLKGGDFR